MTTLGTVEAPAPHPIVTAPVIPPRLAREHRPVVELTRFPTKGEVSDLAAVVVEALGFWPPLWAQSIFGPSWSWIPPHRRGSEFQILDPRKLGRALRFLTAVNLPSRHADPPEILDKLFPDAVNRLFWRPTRTFEQPGLFGEHAPQNGEHWFFINGICTDEAVARINAELLVRLFHRPLTVIQNATNSWSLDLWECAIGKSFRTAPDLGDHGTFTEPVLKATVEILRALNRPEVSRVVVLAHSQGTIIAANVLRAVIKALDDRRRRSRLAVAGTLCDFGVQRAAYTAALELAEEIEETRVEGLRRQIAGELSLLMTTEEEARERVKKLEIYTFACCADKMKHVFHEDGRGYPWIEHFANHRDLIARLGILAPCRSRLECRTIDIDGPLYLREEGSWGHLLNQHYLFGLLDHRDGELADNPYVPAPGAPLRPRLYGYFDGGLPEAPP
jgi:hypothetical protein